MQNATIKASIMKMEKIHYSKLNARQQENYNYQKIASVLADYGFSCMWLNDDWQGADFIANHIDGEEFIRVQLKGRITLASKYIGKNIYIAFRFDNRSYLYPHDEVLYLLEPTIKHTESWAERKGYSWNNPMPKGIEKILEPYIL